MTISRIANLFAANLDSVQRTNARKSAYAQEPPVQTQSQGTESDAVKVSTASSRGNVDPNSDRSAKFAEIKAQVDSGSYKPDGEKVARALIVDIF